MDVLSADVAFVLSAGTADVLSADAKDVSSADASRVVSVLSERASRHPYFRASVHIAILRRTAALAGPSPCGQLYIIILWVLVIWPAVSTAP